jgi:Bacterial SH3 domain
MTRRRLLLGALAILLGLGAAAIGYLLAVSSREPSATPSPTAPAGFSCEVSLSPATIVVDPDTGLAESGQLFLAGTGFPPSSGVTLVLVGTAIDFVTDPSGSFTFTFAPVPGDAYPAPPDLEAGPLTWTVIGWDAPEAPGDFGSMPPQACEEQVSATIELTHSPSPTPPTDLSAGGYAEVIADGVRVRAAPSSTATVIGALFSGDVVRILAPAQVVDGIAWYRVETVVVQSGDPMTGYVAAGVEGQPFLRPTSAPPPPTPSPSATPSPAP